MEKNKWKNLVANLEDLTREVKREGVTSLSIMLDIKDGYMSCLSSTHDVAELASMISLAMHESKKFDELIRTCVKAADLADREEYIKSNFS